MIVAIFIAVLIGFFLLLNVFTLVLPRQFLVKRQESKNAERHAFAMSQGWQFRPFAPELLTTYGCRPFNEQGDRRVVFGVLTGMVDGTQFTVFDYQRRTKRTSYGSVVYNDTHALSTVFVVRLPAALPAFAIANRGLMIFGRSGGEPQTMDPDFNKRYTIEEGEQFAREVLTPQVVAVMRQYQLNDWTIVGSELVYSMPNGMTRTTPQEIIDCCRTLVMLIAGFPAQLWQRYGGTPPPQPQQQLSQPIPQPVHQPQPMPMPQAMPQPMPHPMPQQGGFYPQQQPGWAQAPQPQPQPGYGPPQGYPPQGYPPNNPNTGGYPYGR